LSDPPHEDRIRRREALLQILRLAGVTGVAGGLGIWLENRSRRPQETLATFSKRGFAVPADSNFPKMVVAQGEDPRALVRRALEELGGMQRFIARGDVVVVKPNMVWDRTPEQAANTNPEVVAEVVRLCHDAGAARVVVTDVSCDEPRRCFERSGIAEVARREGALVVLPDETKFREVDLGGDVLKVWPVFEPFLAADKIINIPIAKHHSLTGATLGMKNWYGILGGSRERLHQRINESLVDLAEYMRPTLTIIDAYRVLLRGGPTGGNLEDVALKKTLLAGTDPVALDSYTAKAYWDLDYHRLTYLKMATERGLGTMNFETVPTRVVIL
jgi:uncharacterized protein (DUF362 family)